MRLISNKALVDFGIRYQDAQIPLQAWRQVIESTQFLNFADLKTAFNAIDKVGIFYVFDIGGNKYRLIAAIHFNTQILYIRHVFTHKEYDKWKP
jgi:mRNA interferase HigB